MEGNKPIKHLIKRPILYVLLIIVIISCVFCIKLYNNRNNDKDNGDIEIYQYDSDAICGTNMITLDKDLKMSIDATDGSIENICISFGEDYNELKTNYELFNERYEIITLKVNGKEKEIEPYERSFFVDCTGELNEAGNRELEVYIKNKDTGKNIKIKVPIIAVSLLSEPIDDILIEN